MPKKNRSTKRKLNWRNIPDEILLIKSHRTALDKPESLHPSENTMIRFCEGPFQEEAQEIIGSYPHTLAPTVNVAEKTW